MEYIQLSLFPKTSSHERTQQKKPKQPKLGRYDRIKRDLQQNDLNPDKCWIDISQTKPKYGCYNFVDLFCGAGGMTQGLCQAGYTPLAGVEISKIASETHQRNFPNCHHFNGDIHQFSGKKWLGEIDAPEIHLVAGGPPCQGFSVAGKRNPNDPRNLLFQQFIRVVAELQPWYVVMENVPGILTMKKGAVKHEIFMAFEEIGYGSVAVAILESAEYGIPQIRPRAIFIANRFNLPNPFPKPQLTPDRYKPIESAIADLPEYNRIPEINHEWTNHSAKYMERISKVPPGGSLYKSYADAFKRQYPGKPSMTVKENHGGTHIHPYLNRVISAREMARLQTFPDSFIFTGTMKKAMWQIGNAVPPRLAECVGLALLPYCDRVSSLVQKVDLTDPKSLS